MIGALFFFGSIEFGEPVRCFLIGDPLLRYGLRVVVIPRHMQHNKNKNASLCHICELIRNREKREKKTQNPLTAKFGMYGHLSNKMKSRTHFNRLFDPPLSTSSTVNAKQGLSLSKPGGLRQMHLLHEVSEFDLIRLGT